MAPAIEFRPLEVGDYAECAAVLYEADDELNAQRGLPPMPHNIERLLKLFAQIISSSPERAWLAERAGRIIGFGVAAQRDTMTFLSFLFVRPVEQASGVGRALLERAMAGSDRRAVCIGAIQPISAALYAHYGMVPRVPIYILTGLPAPGLPRLPAGLELQPITDDQLAALDLEVTGITRAMDHRAWQADRHLFGLYEHDVPVGYGYAQTSGRFGPLVVRRSELLLPFTGRLMNEVSPNGVWMVNVPGPAQDTFVGLLKAGLRLEGPPLIYCASEPGIDHRRYLPATFALP